MQATDFSSRTGPLAGVRVVEFAGIGPAPFGVMLLADLGADVLRIDRPGQRVARADVTARGRRSLELDLKDPACAALCLSFIEKADVLVEGFRPGVMEKLGLGPEPALERNPRLIYARMTGWGQTGPLAHAAAHDINYIALTGALAAIGKGEGPPVPPLNLVGDFGGGSLYLAFGIASALFERSVSGEGQIIDAAIVDGTASLMSIFQGFASVGQVDMERGRNLLSGAAPFYGCYACADGKYISIGAIEPHFFSRLLEMLEIDPGVFSNRDHPSSWTAGRQIFADAFARRTRDEWCALLEGTDACFAPVLALQEAPGHAHMKAREIYTERDGMVQPQPAPRFSRTPGRIGTAPVPAGEGGKALLEEWGIS
ncbi:MAG: CoA transferase [Sphingomonadales bacterium]|nr:MAG: CoA transferase [Sphingomonadales bacterium]